MLATNKILQFLLTAISLFAFQKSALGQITIVVNNVPAGTPASDTLFISGDFNNWVSNDPRYILKKSNGSYSVTLPENLEAIEYKITRGSWESVEANIYNKPIDNRVFKNPKVGRPVTHFIWIAGWNDIKNIYKWKIIVQSIPSNTPDDGSIYISGTFNEWSVDDEKYKLVQSASGDFSIDIPKSTDDTILYKFHRGTWSSIESSVTGRFKENRISVWDRDQVTTTIVCEIAGWSDLRTLINFLLNIVLIASAFQCLWLLIVIVTIRNRNHRKTRPLMLLLLLTFVVLISNLVTYNNEKLNALPKLLLVSDIAGVLYAPIAYYLIAEMSGTRRPQRFIKWFCIAAFSVFILLYTPLLLTPSQEFFLKVINKQFAIHFVVAGCLAFCFNLGVWIIAVRLVIRESNSLTANYYFSHAVSYLVMIIVHLGLCLMVWGCSLTAQILSDVFAYSTTHFKETGYDVLWALFALSAYTYSFMVSKKAKLFILKNEHPDEKQKVINPLKEKFPELKSELLLVMQKHKPYLNSNLAIQDLADIMKMNVHTLSWLINEGYNKNFSDFINEYRIEEFKSLATQDRYKKQTFLSIAMQVGFSSKTTFNRAFKKSTGKTPRQYFFNERDSRLDEL